MPLRNPEDTRPIYFDQGLHNRSVVNETSPCHYGSIWRLINWKVVIPVYITMMSAIFTAIAILFIDSTLTSSKPSDRVETGPEPREVTQFDINDVQVFPREDSAVPLPIQKEITPEANDDTLPMPREIVFVIVEKPVELNVPPKTEKKQINGRCDNEGLGTKINFLPLPTDAFQKAKEGNKIVFIMHLAGNFEDGAFT